MPCTCKAARCCPAATPSVIRIGSLDRPGEDRTLFQAESGVSYASGHLIFAREGTTLVAEVPVTFTTAALGGSISLPGVDGNKIDLKVPAGVQSGEQLRHRGSGMSVLNGRGRGDLVARILVETPTKMTAKQKKLLEEFRETETGEECPASKGFFSRARDYFG